MSAELVLVPFERDGAEALHAVASVGLDTNDDHDYGVDLAAGFEANKTLRRTLDAEPDAEATIILEGIAGLEELFTHDKEEILIDPADGTGVLTSESYAALFGLLELLRTGVAEAKGDT